MLKSKKNVFWEALLMTIVVFVFGILLGFAYEQTHLDKINEYYAISEVSLMDMMVLDKLDNSQMNCSSLIESNLDFANRIYDEARKLEKYDDSGKITTDLKAAHQKYDLMRTLLWMRSIDVFERCSDAPNVVVYLYEYKTKDLVKKATQSVWSKVLYDLKQKRGGDIVLIPIAEDSNLASLDLVLSDFNVKQYPVVIVNNKKMIYELSSVEQVEKYLN